MVLLRATNNVLMAADSGSPYLLVLLDLTASFNTMDHSILLHCLQVDIGLCDIVLDQFKSFLYN